MSAFKVFNMTLIFFLFLVLIFEKDRKSAFSIIMTIILVIMVIVWIITQKPEKERATSVGYGAGFGGFGKS